MPTANCDLAAVMARVRASKLRKAGLVGMYAKADSDLGRRVYALAASGRGAYLWGEPGVGKTHAAACAVRMFSDRGGRAKLVTAKALLDAVKAGYDRSDTIRTDALGSAARLPLLALDDLGAERPTPWAMELLTGLIDERTARGLPTVVTSNYSVGQLRDLWGGMEGKRVASRLAGSCERIEVAGPDRRIHG